MKKITLTEFDVTEAVRFILDERNTLPMRAIRLYQFQLAIIMCKRPKPEQTRSGPKRGGPQHAAYGRFVLWVSKAYFARAGAYASMRLLQHMESKAGDLSPDEGRLANMLADQYYVELHEYFSKSDGWSHALSTSRVRDFQDRIQEMRFQARQTSRLIAFSLRFRASPRFPAKLGGITSARDVLGSMEARPHDNVWERFRPRRLVSSLKTYWERHQYVPALVYLGYFEKWKCLRPPNISRRNFGEQLLLKAENREELRRCFGRHDAIGAYLAKERNYSVDLIAVGGLPITKLEDFERLPAAIENLI